MPLTLCFTPSSTARNLVMLRGSGYRERLAGVKLASIGPVRSQKRRVLDSPATVDAAPRAIEWLVEASRQGTPALA